MSRGLTVQEAHNLFRDYVDDPDATFITTAQVQRYLEFGLDQWRDIIRSTNPHLYGTIVKFNDQTVPVSNYSAQPDATKPYRNSLNLSTPNAGAVGLRSSLAAVVHPIMGPEAIADWYDPAGAPDLLQPPIDTILNLYQYNAATNARGDRFRQLRGAQEQELSMFSWTYYLTAETIVFNSTPPDSFILEYFPIARQRMDYTNTNYIENNLLPQFHELIVLMAAKRYMIRDQNVNEVLLREMAAQMQGMINYLTKSRLLGSNDSVSVTMSF